MQKKWEQLSEEEQIKEFENYYVPAFTYNTFFM